MNVDLISLLFLVPFALFDSVNNTAVDIFVRSRIGWEENKTFFIRVWKPLTSRRILKTLRGSPKRTISASGELELLQMVLELDTGRCAIQGLSWTQGGVPTRMLGPEVRWILRSHIDWGGEQNIFYKVEETSP